MAGIDGVEVIVFDVLGTMVDEARGLRTAIREAVPSATAATVDDLFAVWQAHMAREQARMADVGPDGAPARAYANSDVVDRESAREVARRCGVTDPAAIARLATAWRRIPAWDDSVAGLERLARRFLVFGLSNAGRATLPRLNAYAGLRWHQALSAEEARAYKPAPGVYRLAVDAAGCPAERVLMVAAHAWDLRGAQAAGLRAAYVRRPAGDPPAPTDAFAGHYPDLAALATALGA